jgi:hypothetical protein
VNPTNAAALANAMFLTVAGPEMVREVAEILAPLGIPVMPLKGVLLQRLVYKTASFRTMVDVDILVPPARYTDAYHALISAGFSFTAAPTPNEVSLRRPDGWLDLDLHRGLTDSMRCHLRADDMFARGRRDDQLFETSIVLIDPYDLYAHLLQHAAINWVFARKFHHISDFEAVPRVLHLSVEKAALRLSEVKLASYAAVILPMIAAQIDSEFARQLVDHLRLSVRDRAVVTLSRKLLAARAGNHNVRRAAVLALAPSWFGVLAEGCSRVTRRFAVSPR